MHSYQEFEFFTMKMRNRDFFGKEYSFYIFFIYNNDYNFYRFFFVSTMSKEDNNNNTLTNKAEFLLL